MTKNQTFLALAAVALVVLMSWISLDRWGGLPSAEIPEALPLQAVKMPPAADHPAVSALPAVRSAAPRSSHSLFKGGRSTLFEWIRTTPAARRIREVFPDPDLMSPVPVLQQGELLELALFEDAVFSAVISRVTRYPNGAVGITAHLEGGGTAFLSYCGGELRGSITVPGSADWYVRYDTETDAHYAVEVDRENSDCLEGAEPKIPPANHAAETDGPALPAAVKPAGPVELGDIPAGYPADAVQVDVMIVYTPAALTDQGGTNGMNNNIALTMEKANEAHANSDTRVYLNLVHSTGVTYTEAAGSGADLDALTDFDGVIDEVHTVRDTYSADMVCMFVDRDDTGGLGWLLNDEDGQPANAFCIARVQQTDWTYTVVHEWGHNMGCSHSKTQAVQPWTGNLFSYSAGWQWADTKSSTAIGYCSVMTYENFDGSSGDEYERVGHFSNPAISYIGVSTSPTGDAADGDNARTIREVRYAVSDYRIPMSLVSQFPSSSSFENTFSPWRYYEGDTTWDRDRDGTTSSGTGPSVGADGDYYIYIEASGFSYDTALLQAAFDFSGVSSPHIAFSYHLYGADMGSLYLEASTNAGGSWAALWSESGNQGDQWFSTNVSLSAFTGRTNVQLRFRGVIGSGFRSDMALDAVTVNAADLPVDDIDDDGLPDDWETLYFGGATNANPEALCSNGINTVLQAYIAGFDPTDPAAGFGMTGLDAQDRVVQWSAVSGRWYSVFWTDDLGSGFPPVPLMSNLTSGAFTDSVHAAEDAGFYRIEVELAP